MLTDDDAIATKEIYNERAGICEYSGMMTREDAEKQGMLEAQQWKLLCELKEIYHMPIDKRLEYFELVKKARGNKALEKLKAAFVGYWCDMKKRAGK